MLFCVILVSPEFLGEQWAEQMESAKVWRRSYAHDVQYVDSRRLKSRRLLGFKRLQSLRVLGFLYVFIDLKFKYLN